MARASATLSPVRIASAVRSCSRFDFTSWRMAKRRRGKPGQAQARSRPESVRRLWLTRGAHPPHEEADGAKRSEIDEELKAGRLVSVADQDMKHAADDARIRQQP